MRMLYVGDDWVGSNARSLADAFRQAGHEVIVVDTTAASLPGRLTPAWWYAKSTGRRAPWTHRVLHARIDQVAKDFRPDVLFAFKGVYLNQRRLLDVPCGLRVHYSPDDVANPTTTSAEYLALEREWDLVVTTKRHNVAELSARGARRVLFVPSAYDPAWHRPCARRAARTALVGFVGARRPDRSALMVELARAYGGDLLLRGPGWWKAPGLRGTGADVGGPVYGDHFSAAVAGVAANLVLLNSDNRDTHTCRSFEIPAAGGLFVGERTDEHQEMLDEGTQALMFTGREELRAAVDWVRDHPDAAAKIAEAGHRRVTAGRHTYRDRAEEILRALA
ncbi:MAG: glycosyltransferase [Mycobacteriaceae bacterium]|nr:glycosyltransferase [Mycobacteriaceae bacterium]